MALGETRDISVLKVGDAYFRSDLARLLDSPSSAPSVRGGLLLFDNFMLLLLDLDNKEYENHFKGDYFFMNYRKNSTRKTPTIQRFEQGFSTYLLLREKRAIKGKTQPYIYRGKLKFINHQNERPVEIQWQLLKP